MLFFLRRRLHLVFGAVAGLVYFSTSSPSLRFWDSSRFCTAALEMGIALPPGFPLYTSITGILASIFKDNPVWVINNFSALCGAVSISIYYSIYKRINCGKDSIGGAVSSLFLIISQAMWINSTRAEVYTLSLLLVETSIFLILEYSMKKDLRFLTAGLYVWGLAAVNHTAIAAAVLPALFILSGKSFFTFDGFIRRLIFISLAAAAALSFYLFIPIRSSTNPLINWGEVHNWETFWNLISAKEFAFTVNFTGGKDIALRLFEHWNMLYNNFPYFLPIIGFIGLWKTRMQFGWIVLFITTTLTIVSREQLPPGDQQGYLLPAVMVVVLWLGMGLDWMYHVLVVDKKYLKNVLCVLIISTFLFLSLQRYDRNNLHCNFEGEKFGYTLLKDLPPNSIVLFNDISSYFMCEHLQIVKKYRTDCCIILPGMLNKDSKGREWYLNDRLQCTNIAGLDMTGGSTSQVIGRIIENNHKTAPVFCEYGESFRPFINYLFPYGMLFRFAVEEDTMNIKPNASFPEIDNWNDFETVTAYAERYIALSIYYQDAGDMIKAGYYYDKANKTIEKHR